jgi:hypothetical protein
VPIALEGAQSSRYRAPLRTRGILSIQQSPQARPAAITDQSAGAIRSSEWLVDRFAESEALLLKMPEGHLLSFRHESGNAFELPVRGLETERVTAEYAFAPCTPCSRPDFRVAPGSSCEALGRHAVAVGKCYSPARLDQTPLPCITIVKSPHTALPQRRSGARELSSDWVEGSLRQRDFQSWTHRIPSL